MGKPMGFEEYRAERKALAERMDADDERIHECERAASSEWRVGNARGAKYFEDSADNANKDLMACWKKIGALDKDYWDGVENDTSTQKAGAEKEAEAGEDYWKQNQAEKGGEKESPADMSAAPEKRNGTENGL